MPFHSFRKRSRNAFGTSEEELGTMFKNNCQEKMRGQRGRLPVQPSGYVMSTKVIFRRVFVLAEVCLPRRPHACQPRSHVWKKSKDFMYWRTKCHQDPEGDARLHADVSENRLPPEKRDFRSSKNNFRGHDKSQPTPWASLSVPSFYLGSGRWNCFTFSHSKRLTVLSFKSFAVDNVLMHSGSTLAECRIDHFQYSCLLGDLGLQRQRDRRRP